MAKILIVDDDTVNRLYFAQVVLRCGFSFVEAEHGASAVAIAERQVIDAVLMDVAMPIMDGYEATMRIGKIALAAGRQIPVIGVSAHGSSDSMKRGFDSGMIAYLIKPVNSTLLINTLMKSMDRSTSS